MASAAGTIVPPMRVFRKYKLLFVNEFNLEVCVLNSPFISPPLLFAFVHFVTK